MVKPDLLSTVASLSFLLVGYDFATYRYGWPLLANNTGAVNIHLTVLVVVQHAAAILSATASGVAADFFGRKHPLTAAGALFLLGNIFKLCATSSYVLLVFGQLLTALAAGISLTVAPLYIAEHAPALRRGQCTSLPEMWRNVGVLVGYLIHDELAKSSASHVAAQRWLFAIPLVPSILLTSGMALMPESPNWLIIARLRVDEAKRIMQRGERSGAEIDRIPFQMELLAGHTPSLRFMWKDFVRPPLRRLALTVAFVQALRHLGVDVYLELQSLLGLYDVEEKLLKKANGTVLLVKAICSMVAGRLSDVAGSRFLILLSTELTVLFLFMFGMPLIRYHSPPQVYHGSARVLTLVGFGGVMGSFHLGLGPMTWVYATESFFYRARAQGVSLGVVVGQIVELTMYFILAHLFGPLGIGGVYILFAGVMALGFVVCWRFVKDRVEEILLSL